jgi:hypothetical protein
MAYATSSKVELFSEFEDNRMFDIITGSIITIGVFLTVKKLFRNFVLAGISLLRSKYWWFLDP